MIYVTAVDTEPPHILLVTFEDGTRRRVDMTPVIFGYPDGSVFEPLKDPEFFALAYVDEDFGTVCWPGNVDIAPEYLYEHGELLP